MIKLKVKVTKEILKESMMCGCFSPKVASNCAVALAVREIFPEAKVACNIFYPFRPTKRARTVKDLTTRVITSTHDGEEFIRQFDNLKCAPEKRLELPETVVTLDITDEIIDHLSTMIPNYEEVVNAQPNLELVTI